MTTEQEQRKQEGAGELSLRDRQLVIESKRPFLTVKCAFAILTRSMDQLYCVGEAICARASFVRAEDEPTPPVPMPTAADAATTETRTET